MEKQKYPEELTERQSENYDYKAFNDSDSYKEDYAKALKYAKRTKGQLYTMVDGENNKTYYLKGLHYVNRFGFCVLKAIPQTKCFSVNSKDLFDKKKNPNLSLSPREILKNPKIKKTLIASAYYKKHPNITIRADLSKEILTFIKKLKRINKGSQWINEAIKEKYRREN